MIEKWFCSACGEMFDTPSECITHEDNCYIMKQLLCHKCGKKQAYNSKDIDSSVIEAGWHDFNLGKAGYGSELDSLHIKFTLCDKCLVEFIESFNYKEKILGTEHNYYYYNKNNN